MKDWNFAVLEITDTFMFPKLHLNALNQVKTEDLCFFSHYAIHLG